MSLQESNEDIHTIMARAKAARARLRNLAPPPKCVVNMEAAPIAPANVDPFFAYAPVIAAVSEHLGVSREDIIAGASTEFVVQARKLVLALSVRLAMATTADVAEAFAVTPQTVTGAVRIIDPILADLALTRRSPLSQSVKAILSQLQLETLNGIERPSVTEIQKRACREFQVDRDDLLSARRTREIVRPRQIAMSIAKALTLQSLPEIGRRFGGRDHTTVLHAVRKCAPLIQEVSHELGSLRDVDSWCRVARQKWEEMGEGAFA